MRLRRRLSAPGVALLTAGVLFALFLVNVMTLSEITASRAWFGRVRQAQSLIAVIRAGLVDAESSQRGYFLTGRADYLESLRSATATIPPSLEELKRLTPDDPIQQRRMAELEKLATAKLDELRTTTALHERGDAAAALVIVRSDEGKILMDRVRRLISEMRGAEDSRLEQRTANARRKIDAALWIAGGAAVGLLLLGLVLFLINRDIARRQVLESALREAVGFQERFIGILGHDLGNPLAAIRMVARRLEQAGLPENLGKSVLHISSTADRMRRMVDQLLDLTRGRQAGGILIEPKPETDLANLVRSAVEELGAGNPAADIKVDIEEQPKGAWDSDRLVQVVSNVVGNAIIHGVGPVGVRLRQADRFAILEVHNGGPPIPADLIPRIFEAFQHAPDATAARSRGLGLGLFIADRIVSAHGGTIEVRSTEPAGTTFTIKLPTSTPARPRMPASQLSAPSPAVFPSPDRP